MAILPILVLIYIDDNSIAVNAYIHSNNHNCVHYSYCRVYVYTTITITTCIMVIACIYTLTAIKLLSIHIYMAITITLLGYIPMFVSYMFLHSCSAFVMLWTVQNRAWYHKRLLPRATVIILHVFS